jgi:putative phosphoesterase
MRIGIISDVHGDYDTLLTTLDRLTGHHGATHVLCAGDLVGRGPEQNRVVEVIRHRDIISVRGNHDEWFHGITGENTAYLKGLPLDWRGTLAGRRLFMCHGKPGNNMWGMYRDHLSETYLNMMMGALKIDVLVTGHTHMPLLMRVRAGILVNPGSLYTFESSRLSSMTYGVLNLDELTFDVYDARATEVRPVALPT